MTAHRSNDSMGEGARSVQVSTTADADLCQSQNLDSSNPVDGPMPRPKRRPRRAKADQGLPPDVELERLATAYLERQRQHWPQLVEAGLLPEPTEAIIRDMLEDFKVRHRTGKVDIDAVLPFAKASPKLAGCYSRFSCDNSNANSNLDQMVNGLDKARAEDRFVPWAYVFCDYSVTKWSDLFDANSRLTWVRRTAGSS